MHKGQIFSTDLLFGMVIIILGLGLMIGLIETSTYDSKHASNEKYFEEKTQLALMLLTSSKVGQCDLNGITLPNSINTDKINSSTDAISLKKSILLQDYNIQLKLSKEGEVIKETLPGTRTIAIDINVLVCNKNTTFLDLNNCLSSTTICDNRPLISMQTLTLEVGE
jgi:hypothetical protein